MKITPTLFLVLLTISAIAQKKTTTKKAPDYAQEIGAITKHKKVQAAFAIIDQLEPVTRTEHVQLTQVPAPPFHEHVRAAYYKKMIEATGVKVWTDSLGNVLALRKGKTSQRTVVLDAHLDTVFPEGTDLTVKFKGDTLFAPGISDDTRGLIAMLTVLRALQQANIETNDDILFVASLGEEGQGDLRGVRYVVEKSKLKIDSWISIDGTEVEDVVNGGLGSVRYRATIKGPGGHSWGAFGLANPHHAMARALNYFTEEATKFTATGIRTSFNVGVMGGGTSVNSIPFESWAEVDMRSESPSQLKKIDSLFKHNLNRGIGEYNATVQKGPKLTLDLKTLGFRPSGATPETSALIQRTLAAARNFSPVAPRLGIVSTNSNIPISKGISAVTIGAGGKSSKEHSLGEWWLNDHGANGIKFILTVLLSETGIAP
ncbi:MAG TPA: M20/M25/M40 family metallo-hydrolase [Cyclobacteriaceae bacterium]|nr:M20/M25/M40 family metallo-hydrolase [Cyclobacteriaceae bacterium]